MDYVTEQIARAPHWAKVTTLVALPAASAGYILARFLDEYRGWLELGPGGLPFGIQGYMINLLVTSWFARNETTSLGLYSQPEKYAVGWKQASSEEKANAQKSFLKGSLPQREGPRSKSIHYCAPQREKNLDTYHDPEIREVHFKF